MNQHKYLSKFALSSIAALMISGVSFTASAEQWTHDIKEFTAAAPTHTLSAEANSFYNPTMGFNGWLHHTQWGYAKLKKGLPVTITAQTDETLFHPAIAVWQYAGKGPIECAEGLSVGEGNYQAWTDVYIPTVSDASGTTSVSATCSKAIGRNLKLFFVTNGVDRDGWDANPSTDFDTTMINRILDGVDGKVSVTFTPSVTGIYKFAIGGMNPDEALGAVASGSTSTNEGGTFKFRDIDVTVHFPQ